VAEEPFRWACQKRCPRPIFATERSTYSVPQKDTALSASQNQERSRHS
jgi:hypothetical protein